VAALIIFVFACFTGWFYIDERVRDQIAHTNKLERVFSFHLVALFFVFITFTMSVTNLQDAHQKPFSTIGVYSLEIYAFCAELALKGLLFDVVDHFKISLTKLEINHANTFFVWYSFLFRSYFSLMGVKIAVSAVKVLRGVATVEGIHTLWRTRYIWGTRLLLLILLGSISFLVRNWDALPEWLNDVLVPEEQLITSLAADRRISEYTRGLEADPNDARLYAARAVNFRLKREYDSAMADYSTAIALDPQNPHYYAERAWTHFRAGSPNVGLADVQRALALQPGSAYALDTRGHIFEALGHRDEAIADFLNVVKFAPSHKSSVKALRRLHVHP
jgi:tetratricopeptide (TPR) repeat protein